MPFVNDPSSVPGDLAQLYDEHSEALFATAARWLGSRAAAEDCVHDVFAELAYRGFQSRGVSNVRAYVFTALRNAVARVGKRQTLSARAAPVANEAESSDLERAHAVAQAVARLSDIQREVIVLKCDGGLTFAEIAHVVGVPLATAASRYRAAMATLREILFDEERRI